MVIQHDREASLDTCQIYRTLAFSIGLQPLDSQRLRFKGQDPIVSSPHRIGDATAAALGLLATATASILEQRHEILDQVEISIEDAINQLTACFFTKVNGFDLVRFFDDVKLFTDSDFYKAKDGRYVFLLLTYPELRNIACEVLNCPPSRDHYQTEVAKWNALDLEDAISKRGGCCTAVRTREEWRESDVGKASMANDLISIVKIGAHEAMPFPRSEKQVEGLASPLEGIRVLDNSHVIAGPMAARICAEHGAEVLHISSPDHPDPAAMVYETSIGKRNAFADLNSESGREGFWQALKEADVYINSYLSLERKGFSANELVKARPGLIYVQYHGWGSDGEWKERGGFDQLACSATGFAAEEGSLDSPQLPPTYLLNDYLAAILGAAGTAAALERRAREGGSFHVRINLARVCTWVQDLGGFQKADIDGLPSVNHKVDPDNIKIVEGCNGTTNYLPTCIRYKEIGLDLPRGAEPLGASRLHWKKN